MQDRQLYALSPFRGKETEARLKSKVPDDIDLLAFAFPDDNYSDSSVSEKEAKGYQLEITNLTPSKQENKITPMSKFKKDFTFKNLLVVRGNSDKVQEPSSAMMKR